MQYAKLLKTKAGKGLKIVVGNTWFYTSYGEFVKMMNDDAKACNFRTIPQAKK